MSSTELKYKQISEKGKNKVEWSDEGETYRNVKNTPGCLSLRVTIFSLPHHSLNFPISSCWVLIFPTLSHIRRIVKSYWGFILFAYCIFYMISSKLSRSKLESFGKNKPQSSPTTGGQPTCRYFLHLIGSMGENLKINLLTAGICMEKLQGCQVCHSV